MAGQRKCDSDVTALPAERLRYTPLSGREWTEWQPDHLDRGSRCSVAADVLITVGH